MSYIKLLAFVFLILAGCATPSPQDTITPAKPGVAGSLGTSAVDETELYRKAITALNNSQLDSAETELKKLTKTRSEFSGPWINLALIDIKKNDLDGAQKNLNKALERNPKMAQVYNVRGFLELSRGNIAKAVDDYRQAIALKEDYALAHYNYALIHDIYFQDMKMAVRHYKRYLELTQNQDKKTADWVLELERNLAKGSP